MTAESVTVFIDGENLACRYHEMVKLGRRPRATNVEIDKFFVWNELIFRTYLMSMQRVNYYTSCAGDDMQLEHARRSISNVTYKCYYQQTIGADGTLHYHGMDGRMNPIVKKRRKNSAKESICDIAIAVDVLRACYRDHSDRIWIVSGDGDFLPLIQEAMHSGKQVQIAALSSGLNPQLEFASDDFLLLDDFFFEKDEGEAGPAQEEPDGVVGSKQEAAP